MATYSNFGVSLVAGGAGGAGTSLNPADTSLLLHAGDGNAKYPAAAPFMILLGNAFGVNELAKCTARAADTLTLVRAQEGTTAQTWIVGTPVTQVTTAGNMNNLSSAFNVKDYGAAGNGAADDTAAIQAALNAASAAGGGTVYLPAGTYEISTQLNVPSNVSLQGDGFESCIQRKSGPNYCNLLSLSSVSNIRISHLQLDGRKNEIITSSNGTNYNTAIALAYTQLAGIYITGATQATPSTNIHIDHCWIHDSFFGNVQPDNVNGLTISNNMIYLGRDNQINVRVVGGSGGSCTSVAITGNVIYGTGYPFPATSDQFNGICLIRCTNAVIQGNVVTGMGNTNTTEGSGIKLEGGRYVAIQGNTCSGNLTQGITIDQTIEGVPDQWLQNIAYVPGDCVTYLGHQFSAATYNKDATPPATATSNANWTYQAAGPFTQFAVDITVEGNACCNNDFSTATGVTSYGVQTLHCENVVIKSNQISGNVRGIDINQASKSVTADGNSIFQNSGPGVSLYWNSNFPGPAVISNNYIARNGAKAIDSVVPVTIIGNTIVANGGAGASLNITGTTTIPKPATIVQNNTFIDNGDSSVLVNSGWAYACTLDVRNNYCPASSTSPRFISDTGSLTNVVVRCVNNRVGPQGQQTYNFTTAGTFVWVDEASHHYAQTAANYSADTAANGWQFDEYIEVTGGTGLTITLPTPSGTGGVTNSVPNAGPGRRFVLINSTANSVTVKDQSANTYTALGASAVATYVSNGTTYKVAA